MQLKVFIVALLHSRHLTSPTPTEQTTAVDGFLVIFALHFHPLPSAFLIGLEHRGSVLVEALLSCPGVTVFLYQAES